jgi:hypothetical protein
VTGHGRWGASKRVLVLAAERRLYTVVLAEAVERELQRNAAYPLRCHLCHVADARRRVCMLR